MSNVKEYQHFINGGWKPGLSGEMMDVINPANGEVVARVPKGNDADVDIAIKAAKASFESGVWSEKPVKERVKVLYDVAAELKKMSSTSLTLKLFLQVVRFAKLSKWMRLQSSLNFIT